MKPTFHKIGFPSIIQTKEHFVLNICVSELCICHLLQKPLLMNKNKHTDTVNGPPSPPLLSVMLATVGVC